MTLTLPKGTKAGSLVVVTWEGTEESIDSGTYEGRVMGIKGTRVTLNFVYEGDPEPEIVVVNLATGIDETNHARVSSIRPVSRK